jgi:hypothetical protein
LGRNQDERCNGSEAADIRGIPSGKGFVAGNIRQERGSS